MNKENDNEIKNCEKCDIENWCENKEKELCVMMLKPGDKIKFIDSNSGKEYTDIVKEITKTQNVDFQDWGINGVYVTNIEKLEVGRNDYGIHNKAI